MQITNPTALKIQQALAPVQSAATNVNTAMVQGTTMASDSYSPSTMTQPVSQKVPLYHFFDDPMKPPHPLNQKIADRLSWIGVNDSESFLKVANTPFKRKLISYLGAGLFIGKADRQYVDYQLSAWAGQSDLMRTGADLKTARLLQMSGAGDTGMLSRYSNVVDRGALYAAMSANALQYGYWMPPFDTVSSLVEKSRGLPPVVRW